MYGENVCPNAQEPPTARPPARSWWTPVAVTVWASSAGSPVPTGRCGPWVAVPSGRPSRTGSGPRSSWSSSGPGPHGSTPAAGVRCCERGPGAGALVRRREPRRRRGAVRPARRDPRPDATAGPPLAAAAGPALRGRARSGPVRPLGSGPCAVPGPRGGRRDTPAELRSWASSFREHDYALARLADGLPYEFVARDNASWYGLVMRPLSPSPTPHRQG